MKSKRYLWLVTLLVAAGSLGCGAPCSCPSTGDGEGSSGDEVAAPNITNPELAHVLTQMCTFTTEAMADRRIPLNDRMQGVERRFQTLPPTEYEVGETFMEAIPERPRESMFARIVTAAETQGVPGFTCPALERAFALAAARDEDLEPNMAYDLARWCETAAGIEESHEGGDYPDLDSLLVNLAQEVDRILTHPTTQEIFRALAAAPIEERYALLIRGAEAEGFEGWSCEPLERIYQLNTGAAPE